MDTLPDDYFTDPHRTYRDWRARRGVHRVLLPDGMPGWLVTGYAESRAALADPRLRKSAAGADELLNQLGFPSVNRLSLTNHMLNSDPPDHTRLRKLVNTAFTAGAVACGRGSRRSPARCSMTWPPTTRWTSSRRSPSRCRSR